MTTNPSNAPFSQEAEEAVIGSVLINPETYLTVATHVQAKDFFIKRHEYIWAAIAALGDRDEQIDYLTVQEELKGRRQLDEVGGGGYLVTLINNTPTSIHADIYARLVRRASIRRAMLEAADAIRNLAIDESMSVEDAYLTGMQQYDAIHVEDRQHYLPGAISIRKYDEILDDIARRKQAGDMIGFPLPRQWTRLAASVPMVYPGEFVVISGMPGSGKSAMMETWAEHCALLGLRVVYMHTEMSTDQILHRRMARYSGVPYHTLASGEYGDVAAQRMLEADANHIARFTNNIAYHWLPDVPFPRLAQEMKLAAQRGVKVFFLDHFQDVQPPPGSNEIRAFEAMCVWFAAFAEYRRVVVIMASQQNEQGKTKWTKKLIEKAVTWISIKRPRLSNEYVYAYDGAEVRAQPGEDSPESEVFVSKARFGKKGKLKMLYHGPRFAWLDMSQIRRPFSGGVAAPVTLSNDQLTAQLNAGDIRQ